MCFCLYSLELPKVSTMNTIKRQQKRKMSLLKFWFLGLIIVALSFRSYGQCPPVITVTPLGGATISGNSVEFCAGDSVLLTSTAGPSYQWYQGANPINDSTRQSLVVASGGTYYVEVGGCISMASPISVTVHPLPSASISCVPPPPICSGTQITLTVTSNGDQITWLQPSLTTTNPLVLSPTNSFIGKAIAINSATGCSRVVTYPVQVDFPINGGQIASNQTICPGNTPAALTQTAAPSGGNGTYFYTWYSSTNSATGPWSLISGANAPTYAPGSLTVTTWYRRTVTSPPCADGLSNVIKITVNPNPTITSASTKNICSGNSVNYTPTSGVSGTTFSWNSTVISGTVTGAGSGTGTINNVLSLPTGIVTPAVVRYTITPTGPVPSNCPGTPATLTVTVYPVPEILNAVNNQTVCGGAPTTAVIFNTAVTGTTFAWTSTASSGLSGFPASGTGNIPSFTPVNVTLNPGTITYTVTPTGPTPQSCPGPTYTYTYTVNPAPTVINSPMSQTVCSGNNTTAVNIQSNVAGTTFTWTASASSPDITGFSVSGTNSIPVQQISNSSSTQGSVTYHITPFSGSGGCPAAARDYIIYINPIPQMTSATSAQVCSGTPLNYTITSNVSGVTYAWSRPLTGGISNAAASGGSASINETLINTTTTSKLVTYNINITGPTPTNCMGPTSQLQVTVRPLPAVNAGNDQTIPYGSATTLNGTVTVETPPATYTWTPSASVASGGAALSATTTNLYTNTAFTLKAVDGSSCQNTDVVWVYLSGTPLAVTATASPSTICQGSGTPLNASATGGTGTYTFAWSPTTGLNNPNISNPTAAPASTTTYTVTVNDGFNTATKTVTVTVIPTPTAFNVGGGGEMCFSGSGLPITLSSSQTNVTYYLMLNGVPVTGGDKLGTGSALTWANQTSSGTYTVTSTTNTNSCPGAMNGSALITINPLPLQYTITGGGSYQAGGPGVPIGLSGSQSGVSYELELIGTGVVAPSPVNGTGGPISFGLQTQFGTYRVIATDQTHTTHCRNTMAGTVSVVINPIPTTYTVTGGGIFCSGEPGMPIGLTGSELGINYYLRRNGVATGTVLSGTGFPLSFGNITLTGNYTVYAQNASNGASVMMSGIAVITQLPAPTVYSLVPTGLRCPGTELFLNGSQNGIRYILYRNGLEFDTLTGTGGLGLFSFGVMNHDGNYVIWAEDPINGCRRQMTGALAIAELPQVFSVIPAGILCQDEEIFLDGSQTGIEYQLRRDETFNSGAPLTGTGSILNFGSPSLPGTYSVWAIDPISLCEIEMADSALLYPLPTSFAIIPQGDTCGPLEVRLGGSEIGYTYELRRNGAYPPVITKPGTGNELSFGVQSIAGTYTVIATSNVSMCQTLMTGQTLILPKPQKFNMTPIGTLCAGQTIGLDGSQAGVAYQLMRDDTIKMGIPITGTGGPISFGAQVLTGKYTVEAQHPSSQCSEFMNGQAILLPTPALYVITPQGTECTGFNVGLNGSQVGINYQLIRDGQITTPVSVLAGTGAALDFGVMNTPGSYIVVAINPITACQSTMTGTLDLLKRPNVYTLQPAGQNCEPTVISIAGSETGVNYELFKDGNPMSPTVIVNGTGSAINFGSRNAGTYTVKAINGTSGCESSMNGSVIISPLPTVTLAATQTLCQGTSATLTPSAANFSSLQWYTTGDGSFSNPTALLTTYTPGAADFTAGTVTVTIKAFGSAICPGTNSSASQIITIDPLPQANAGSDQTICQSSVVTLNGSTLHSSSVLWSTTGDGSFTAANQAITSYAPGVNDKINGVVTLTLTAYGSATCAASTASDAMVITMNPAPTIEAGSAQTICANSPVLLNASATNTATTLWSTSGTGSFSNGAALTTEYYPSSADITTGGVWLKLTATGLLSCGTQTIKDSLYVTINPLPTANAGADLAMCVSQVSIAINGSASNNSSVTWSTSGDGSFNNLSTLTPIYTPGTADVLSGTVTLTLTTTGNLTCASQIATDQMSLSIMQLPVANAGADATICSNATYTLSGQAINAASVHWTTSGNGTFSDANILNAIYTPGSNDIIAGNVTLTLTAYGSSVCGSGAVTDALVLTLSHTPVIEAGVSQTICSNGLASLNGTSQYTSAISWITRGSGTFNNNTLLNPLYTPSSGDIANGSVWLIMYGTGITPCATTTLADSVLIIIDPMPVANAGVDQTICATGQVVLNGTALHEAYHLWSTAGDGSFVNSASLNTTYIPGVNDLANGMVTLTLTSYGTSSCALFTVSDQMLVTINPAAQVNAGTDQIICANTTALVSGSTINATGVIWSTSGTGSFSNAGALSTTYTPSAADISSGSVWLKLSALGTFACNSQVAKDSLKLTINPLPTANAGADKSICISQSSVLLNGIATNQSSVVWTTNGDGTFSNATSLTNNYLPGPADKINGTVTLTLSVTGRLQCATVTVTDQMVINIAPLPVVNAGPDATVCSSDLFTLSGSSLNTSSVKWSTSGDGTFDNKFSLTATYTPGINDKIAGLVTLTLNGFGASACASSTTWDEMQLHLSPTPFINAGTDQTVCATSTVQLNAVASNYSTVTWYTRGSGSFSNNGILNPVYTPSTADTTLGSVWLVARATGVNPCATILANDSLLVSFVSSPQVNAGVDQDICASATAILSGSVINSAYNIWSTSGDGNFQSNTALNTIYTPGPNDRINGTATLTHTAYGTGVCGAASASDHLTLTIHPLPQVEAGADQTICASSNVALTATATNAGSVLWTTSGTGSFANAGALSTTYFPSAADKTAGSVKLKIRATGIFTCNSQILYDSLRVVINPLPTVNAGPDRSMCVSQGNIVLNGAATNQSAVLWSTAGDGTFNNPAILTSTYTPGPNDVLTGSVVITLRATGNLTCSSQQVTDALILTINPVPTVNAGPDATVCANNSYTLTGQSYNTSSVKWTSSGDGTFDNSTILTATYTPGLVDKASGVVILTLTGTGNSACITSTVTDAMTLHLSPLPSVEAGANKTICANGTVQLNGTSANTSSTIWITRGSGSFTNNSILNPVYSPSPADITAGSVWLIFRGTGITPCATVTQSDSLLVTITPLPTANAGVDQTVCMGQVASLMGTATNYHHLLWTSPGDGTLINATSLNASYSPGVNDLTNGSVTLTLTVWGNGTCGTTTAIDQIVISVQPKPTVNAGPDGNVCSGSGYVLTGIAANYSTVTWSSHGDGSFSNSAILTPTYNPGPNDKATGHVWIKLTVNGIGACGSFAAADSLSLTIDPRPVANAGADVSTCFRDAVQLSGSASNYASVSWNTSGDGVFSNGSILSPQYTPGPTDAANGSVVLTLTANGSQSCSSETHSDQVIVTINRLPIANAGSDATICSNASYNLTGQAQYSASSLWSTTGDGTFANPASLITTYTPGVADRAAGMVTITLTAYGTGTCATTSNSDQMILRLSPLPVVDAGANQTICASNTAQLNATAQNQSSQVWITRGNGTFSSTTALNPIYTPSPADKSAGAVWLVIRVSGVSPCGTARSSDSLLLTIHPLPIANAGPDRQTCNNASLVINGSASNATSINWATAGDGTLLQGTTPTPTYTPGPADIAAGSVTLTMTAIGSGMCNSSVSTDQMIITIQPLPVPHAGPDDVICGSGVHQLNGTATNYTTLVWTTSGDGTFNNTGILAPTYNPGPNDDLIGHVWLKLTAYGQYTCQTVTRSDSMKLTIDPLPTANAGSNRQICFRDPIQINGAATNYNSIAWSTNGDGLFNDIHSLNPIYTPGQEDANNGTVTLTITAQGRLTCSTEIATDQMVLTLLPLPIANAGNDTAICMGQPLQCNGEAQNASGVRWYTSGDGLFNNAQILDPVYIPGTFDRINGSVRLWMRAAGSTLCGLYSNTDTLTLNLRTLPSAIISGNAEICTGETAQLTVLLTGTPPWSITYTNTLQSWTIDNILVSPYTFDVAPSTTTGYFLTGVSDAFCSGNDLTGSAVVTVKPQPHSFTVFAASNGTFCEGSQGAEIRLSGSEIGVSYQLKWGNVNVGSVVYGTGFAISFGNHVLPGTYTVLASTLGSGCQALMAGEVNLMVIPSPEVNFMADTVCFGSPTNVTLSGNNLGDVVTFEWNFGDGQIVTYYSPISPSHTYLAPGEYNVKLTATNIAGCETSVMQLVKVLEPAEPFFWWDGSTCENAEVTFENLSFTTAPEYITQWHWDFGDGQTSTVVWPANPNVTHSFTNSGNYPVTLTVTTSNGCEASLTRIVNIKPAPMANFVTSSACQGLNVQFTDISQSAGAGNIEQWHWNFGDPNSGTSNTSTLQNPVHAYSTTGIFTAILEITTNNGCSDTVHKTIVVLPAPVAAFIADTACLGSPTQFQDQSTASTGNIITNWLWDFGDGSTPSNSQNPTHTYSNAGVYTVRLTVTDNTQCSNTATNLVRVAPIPVAVFTSSTANCAGQAVLFDEMSTTTEGYITQWQWDYGNGNSTTVNFPDNPDVAYAYSTPGTYQVTLTVTTSTGCEASIGHPVTVNSTPTANFSTPTGNCPGQAVLFTDQSQLNGGTPITNWWWDFGDPLSGVANTSTLQNPTHLYNTPGTYSVKLIVRNATYCYDTITKDLSIGNGPTANFDADSTCLGNPTLFTDLSTGGGSPVSSWLWNFGDGFTSTQQNPQHLYLTYGSFNVNLTVSTLNGCYADTTLPVFVKPNPSAAFTWDETCAGAPVQFNDMSITPSSVIQSWLWDFGDGSTSSEQNPQHLFAQGGTYVVTLTVTNNYGCSNTTQTALLVHERPTADFSFLTHYCPAGTVEFFNQTVGNGTTVTNYNWNFGDGYVSTLTNPVYEYAFADSCYDVSLMVTNNWGCRDTIMKQVCTKPAMNFTIGYEDGCNGKPIQFHAVNLATGDSLLSVRWNFGDPASGPSNTSLLNHPTHTFSGPGTYLVKLKIWNSDYCIDSTYTQVLVKELPAAGFSWNPGPHCDSTVTFVANWNGAYSLLTSATWDFGDGTTQTIAQPIPNTISHTFTGYGNWPVRLSYITQTGCEGDTTISVNVKCVDLNFSVLDTLICQFSPAIFADSTQPAGSVTSWTWEFGDGQSVSYTTFKPNLTHIFDTSGLFMVKMKTTVMVNGVALIDSITKPVIVQPKPRAAFSFNGHCEGTPIAFNDATTIHAGNIASRLWNFGDGLTGSGASTNHIFDGTSPVYSVSLIATSDHGCSDTVIQNIIVDTKPLIYLTPGDGMLCGQPVEVTMRDTSGNDYTLYEWSLNGGNWINTDTSELALFMEPGPNQVVLQAINELGCISRDTAHYQVYRKPEANFRSSADSVSILSGEIEFIDLSIPGDALINQWSWNFGDGTDTLRQDVAHIFTSTGRYRVSLMVTDTRGCFDTTSREIKIFSFTSFYVPNAFSPNWDNINPTFGPVGQFDAISDYTFRIFDRWGQLIFESPSPDLQWDGRSNNGDAPSGQYIWILSFKYKDGKPENQTGSVILVR